MVRKAFKYRFYPTADQERNLAQTFGCVRYVWNWALDKRTRSWYDDHTSLSYNPLSAMLTELKHDDDHDWLNEVSAVPLQQALRHQQRAFINFFEKRCGYPRFKSRHRRQSAEYTRSAFTWRNGELKLAKQTEPLHIVWSRPLPAEPTTATVSKDRAGRYFVSLACETEPTPVPPAPNPVVGIDLGINDLVVLSTGEKVPNPRHEKRDQQKLVRVQHELSRKQKGSNNRHKARRKVARIHARIADRRRDHLHKLSTRMIRENQTVCVEDLAVVNMVKNHNLARSIHDASWGELVRQLEYKADWYGREVVKINRFYPSTKRCFECGTVRDRVPLSERSWTCPNCGASHDRDVNAARNILAAGLAVKACGEVVRPTGAHVAPGADFSEAGRS